MHATYHVPITLSVLSYSKELMVEIDEALKAKGLKEYWTLVDSVEAFKYCEMMGFKTTKEVINNKYEYMKKDLI